MSVFQVKIDQGIESQDQVAHYRLILPEEKDMLFFLQIEIEKRRTIRYKYWGKTLLYIEL